MQRTLLCVAFAFATTAYAQQQAWTPLVDLGATGVVVSHSPLVPRVIAAQPLGNATRVLDFVDGGFQLRSEVLPQALSGVQVATYDPVGRRIVTYNSTATGIGGPTVPTWCAFDGAHWTSTSGGPTERRSPAMAHDPVRGTTILFGGLLPSFADGTPFDDTWELDGNTWTQLAPATRPPARQRTELAVDPTSGRLVLFGGTANLLETVLFDDTWTFDGADWIQLAPLHTPPARRGHTLATDPAGNGVFLYGGLGAGNVALGDAWFFDGTDWSQLAAPLGGAALTEARFARDGNALLLIGRGSAPSSTVRVLRWSGSSFDPIFAGTDLRAVSLPAHGLDTLRGEIVRFGGRDLSVVPSVYVDETWTFDGEWHREFPANSPPPRSFAPLAFDPIRGEMLLFGGIGGVTALADTWIWNGADWLQRFPVNAPAARQRHALAFDPSRNTVVLHGGFGDTQTFTDTWEFDGTNWTPIATATQPPPRTGSLAYDVARGVLVFYADHGSVQPSELWKLESTGWVLLDASAPAQGKLVYDPVSANLALFGPSSGRFDFANGAWVAAGQGNGGLDYTYDPARGGLLGMGTVVSLSTTTPAEHEVYGSGCGSAGTATLAFDQLPRLGATMRAVVRAPLPGAGVIVFFGLVPTNLPFLGCTQLVDFLILDFQGTADANGWARIATTVPPFPALAGFDAWAQGFVVYPAPQLGQFALTNGVRLQLGL